MAVIHSTFILFIMVITQVAGCFEVQTKVSEMNDILSKLNINLMVCSLINLLIEKKESDKPLQNVLSTIVEPYTTGSFTL